MPVRAIQKKWAPRAVLFFWEIGGYMALAVLIAVMADGLGWTLNIGVAVLAGAAAAGIVQFALSRNLRMANSAGQRVNAAILTHYVREGWKAEWLKPSGRRTFNRRPFAHVGFRGLIERHWNTEPECRWVWTVTLDRLNRRPSYELWQRRAATLGSTDNLKQNKASLLMF